jgi:hypothetical protein
MPKLFKLRKPISPPPEQSLFMQNCQHTCVQHAQKVASVIAEAMKHGTNILADTWTETIAYDSTRVMLYYITDILGASTDRGKETVDRVTPLLRSNIKALGSMVRMFATSRTLVRCECWSLRHHNL